MSVVEDLTAAAAFSAGGPGVTRLAWSPPLLRLYDHLAARLRGLGMEATVDSAGNLIGRWDAGSGRAVLAGSHLDTVPDGGRFDGALGVLAAVRAVELLQERGTVPRRPLWIASFMDEEGSRFGASMFGSRAFAGEDVSGLLGRADAHGTTVAAAMRAAGFDPSAVSRARAIDAVGAYLELHIEQGPVLERAGCDIGAVTGIVGIVRLQATFAGEANHAGTTPMDARRDALVAAGRAVPALRDLALGSGGEVVVTVGELSVAPGSYNVVPGGARMSVDVRSADAAALAEAAEEARRALERIAAEEDVAVDVEEVHRLEPTPLDPRLVDAVEAAAERCGAAVRRMASGAGHDAMILAPHLPAAMLFVPSRAGISHNPSEFTAPEACELGAAVLAEALAALLCADELPCRDGHKQYKISSWPA